MRRVRSPFVAEVLDTDVTSETPYIVTRYVPGRTLDEVVTQEGPLSGSRLIRVAAGLRCPGRDPRGGCGAPRPEAGQCHADERRPGRDRLRYRPGPGLHPAHHDGHVHGHARLPVPGSDRGAEQHLVLGCARLGGHRRLRRDRAPAVRHRLYETIFYRIVNGQPDLSGVPAPMAELLAAALRRDPAQRPAAIQLRSRAAALDPAVLLPLAVPAGGQPGMGQPGMGRWIGPGGPGTRADGSPLRPTALDGLAGTTGRAGPCSPGPARAPARSRRPRAGWRRTGPSRLPPGRSARTTSRTSSRR